ncbi:hypothetical protein IHQ71_09060 [Rhizobium sp. TH2]|uniref:hypothetical protein n=1 Tax=Rhizobium sp. TH2 TaxID=2775403 RepID=UPI0021583B8E|nr:hypothetical protein [Rhizobium sp. TH2]UVC10708.1 hypothetical protein IHQ71_09060 [Rhizobium sp. TH2]
MKLNRSFSVLLAGTAFFGFANSAFALDGNDVLAKINAVYSVQGGKIEAASTSVDGANVKLTGVTVSAAGTDGKSFPIGDVTLENVEEGDEGYTIEKIAFSDINTTQEGATITATGMSIGGVYIPNEPKPGTIDSMMLYENFAVGPVTVSAQGKQVFAFEGAEGNLTAAEDQSKFDFDATVSGVNIDMTAAPDPKAQEAITALGLQNVKGEVTMKGSWTVADGKFEMSEYAFDFDNVGRLDINFSMSGYTLDFIKAMQDAVKASETNPDKAAGQQALGMAMMGLMQQLIYNGASVRFDDAGITAKALEFAGKQQGVDGKQMAQSLKGMLPMMLGMMNMPDLQKQIEAAAGAYLDDPKSLTVSANPAQPLAAPQIMGAAMGDPANLVKTLNVQVTAND